LPVYHIKIKIWSHNPGVLFLDISECDSCLNCSGYGCEYRLEELYNSPGGIDSNVNLKDVDDSRLASHELSFATVTDRAELQASAAYDITKYQDHDELDTTDQYYQIITGLAASPLLSLDITGTYVIDYTFGVRSGGGGSNR